MLITSLEALSLAENRLRSLLYSENEPSVVIQSVLDIKLWRLRIILALGFLRVAERTQAKSIATDCVLAPKSNDKLNSITPQCCQTHPCTFAHTYIYRMSKGVVDGRRPWGVPNDGVHRNQSPASALFRIQPLLAGWPGDVTTAPHPAHKTNPRHTNTCLQYILTTYYIVLLVLSLTCALWYDRNAFHLG